MFRVKLESQILDFLYNFELLHFQFDRWLYKTVSGMITWPNTKNIYQTFTKFIIIFLNNYPNIDITEITMHLYSF